MRPPSLHAKLLVGALVAAAGLASAPRAAWAGSDWFTSVYSAGGVEVRADERIFTLYALLNAVGYDEAPVLRKTPVVQRDFSPIRIRVRRALSGLDAALEGRINDFFDAHPLPVGRYLAYTAQLGSAPDFAAPAGIQPTELSGFEKLLADVYREGKVRDLFAEVQAAYRADTESYLAAIDLPLAKAGALLKAGHLRPVVAVNDLDGRGVVQGVPLASEALLVLGPSAKPDVAAAVRAYARAVLDPVVEKKAGALRGAAEQAAVVRGSGGPALALAADYASELLARAVAIRAASQDPAADEDAALKLGFAGIKEAVRGVDELAKTDRPLEVIVPEILARIDLKRAASARGN